jgi:hypothetical protein
MVKGWCFYWHVAGVKMLYAASGFKRYLPVIITVKTLAATAYFTAIGLLMARMNGKQV